MKLETSAKWRGWLALILLAIGALHFGLAFRISAAMVAQQPSNSAPATIGKARRQAAGKNRDPSAFDPARAERRANESLVGMLGLMGLIFVIPGFYLASRWWAIRRKMQEIDYLSRALR